MQSLMFFLKSRTKIFIKNIFPSLFIANPFLSSFYYFLFSSHFRREQHAVLVGKLLHLKGGKLNEFTLKRNIHRIEKGLLMVPRRPIFALDFIEETVGAFVNISKDKFFHSKQQKWALDVLNEYFQSSGYHPIIDLQRKVFTDFLTKSAISVSSYNKSIPYIRSEINKSNVSFEEFYKLLLYRRSVRRFLNKKVPRELIDKALLAASQSPSACNRQPFKYYVVDELNLLKEITNLPMGIKGYSEGIQVFIIVVGNLDAYFEERDRHLIYIDASLSNMTFMLALETLGLSSCPINWPDIESLELKMENLLKLEKHQRPIMCMAVGYADPNCFVAFSEKVELEDFRKYNL